MGVDVSDERLAPLVSAGSYLDHDGVNSGEDAGCQHGHGGRQREGSHNVSATKRVLGGQETSNSVVKKSE